MDNEITPQSIRHDNDELLRYRERREAVERHEPGTLGDMTLIDLIKSLDSEVAGLDKHLEGHHLHNLITRAYIGSIRARAFNIEEKLQLIVRALELEAQR